MFAARRGATRVILTWVTVVILELIHAPKPGVFGRVVFAARRSAVLCCAVWCGAVRCGVVRCGAVWCGAVRCCAKRCGAVRCGAVRCDDSFMSRNTRPPEVQTGDVTRRRFHTSRRSRPNSMSGLKRARLRASVGIRCCAAACRHAHLRLTVLDMLFVAATDAGQMLCVLRMSVGMRCGAETWRYAHCCALARGGTKRAVSGRVK